MDIDAGPQRWGVTAWGTSAGAGQAGPFLSLGHPSQPPPALKTGPGSCPQPLCPQSRTGHGGRVTCSSPPDRLWPPGLHQPHCCLRLCVWSERGTQGHQRSPGTLCLLSSDSPDQRPVAFPHCVPPRSLPLCPLGAQTALGDTCCLSWPCGGWDSPGNHSKWDHIGSGATKEPSDGTAPALRQLEFWAGSAGVRPGTGGRPRMASALTCPLHSARRPCSPAPPAPVFALGLWSHGP